MKNIVNRGFHSGGKDSPRSFTREAKTPRRIKFHEVNFSTEPYSKWSGVFLIVKTLPGNKVTDTDSPCRTKYYRYHIGEKNIDTDTFAETAVLQKIHLKLSQANCF